MHNHSRVAHLKGLYATFDDEDNCDGDGGTYGAGACEYDDDDPPR